MILGALAMISAVLDPKSGHLAVSASDGLSHLPALWLRERSCADDQMDLVSHQRLYDPTALPHDLAIVSAEVDGSLSDMLNVTFSDGHCCAFDLEDLAVEAGLVADPTAIPPAEAWTATTAPEIRVSWHDLDREDVLLGLLEGFFRSGFAVLQNTPTEEDSLATIAERFGPIRETNWGRLFNVRTKPAATDLAYTGLALAAHTDNPYRRSVPGIQFLHCLENGAIGGESLLVDGMALAECLQEEAPEEFEVLSSLVVSFRYNSHTVYDRRDAPLLDLGPDGSLRHIRLSTRLDFTPAADPETLELFYRGRRRLMTLASDPRFTVRFKMSPGDCLMMDNHRTLHGRTAFAAAESRFLQGCYIDHDGPESCFRVLGRDRRRASRQAGNSIAA